MRKKIVISSEGAYLLGNVILALGTALMELAGFGMSMVVAPAYVLYLRINPVLPFFTFGMAEYSLQAVLLILMCLILRRAKISYLFSFVTAVFYGFVLDGCMALAALLPEAALFARHIYFAAGLILCSIGISFFFHTYIAPEAYELLVKELSSSLHKPIPRVKTVYDLISCGVAVLMSFLFFGFGVFRGVRIGTVFCALINGTLIGLCGKIMDKRIVYRDRLKFRGLFEK